MRVLIATDGSPCSQRALQSVISSKWADGSQFKIVMVDDFNEPLPTLASVREKDVEQARQHITYCVKTLQTAFPAAKVDGQLLSGYADEKILEAAGQFGANLIVVGSHGRTGLQQFFLGSVSRSVLHSGACAVRIVRSTNSNLHVQHNVLIALDLAEQGQDTLDHVLSSAWPAETEFKCITVLSPEHRYLLTDTKMEEYMQQKHMELRNNSVNLLQTAVAALSRTFPENTAHYEILEGETRDQILSCADSWPASLIVLGSHSRKFMERVLIGSVSEAVAVHGHCSVEVARSQAMESSHPPTKKMHVII